MHRVKLLYQIKFTLLWHPGIGEPEWKGGFVVDSPTVIEPHSFFVGFRIKRLYYNRHKTVVNTAEF